MRRRQSRTRPPLAVVASVATVTFVFETSHHAFLAEDLAAEASVPVEVVPAPSNASAKCGIALRVAAERAGDLEETLQGNDVTYETFDQA